MEAFGVSQTRGAGKGESATAPPPPRLVKAAHEFEAQMMKELMTPLTRGSAVPGVGGNTDEDDQDSGSAGALGEFAAESLGQALSAAGGFGIANRILGEIGHAGVTPGNHGDFSG
jgi:hypothetical protein